MLCEYGCNQESLFQLKNGKRCCSERWNACPANRIKNSLGVAKAHAKGLLKTFTKEHLLQSQESHRNKLMNKNSFENLGPQLRKVILLKEQNYTCKHCGIGEWNNKEIILEVDHIDGNHENNKKENLRLLCPNCHSQTDTWKRGSEKKNRGWQLAKHTEEEIIEAVKNTYCMNQVLKKLKLQWSCAYRIQNIMTKNNLSFIDNNEIHVPMEKLVNS